MITRGEEPREILTALVLNVDILQLCQHRRGANRRLKKKCRQHPWLKDVGFYSVTLVVTPWLIQLLECRKFIAQRNTRSKYCSKETTNRNNIDQSFWGPLLFSTNERERNFTWTIDITLVFDLLLRILYKGVTKSNLHHQESLRYSFLRFHSREDHIFRRRFQVWPFCALSVENWDPVRRH